MRMWTWFEDDTLWEKLESFLGCIIIAGIGTKTGQFHFQLGLLADKTQVVLREQLPRVTLADARQIRGRRLRRDVVRAAR